MKKAIKLLAMLLAIMLVFSLFSACAAPEDETPGGENAPSPGGENTPSGGDTVATDEYKVLRVGTAKSYGQFDPARMVGCVGTILVYDTLLERDPETGEYAPNIVTEWEWVAENTLKMTMRDDVYFTNGEQATPQDIVNSLKWFTEGDAYFMEHCRYDNINFDNIVIDGFDLTIEFYEPDPLFLNSITNSRWGCLLNLDWLTTVSDDDVYLTPIGTGAYICTENINGDHSTYVRNENYWGDEPEVDEVVLITYSEQTTMMIDFENGSIDMVCNVTDSNLQRVINGEVPGNYQLIEMYDIVSIGLPDFVEVFQDPVVREAVALCVDSDSLTRLCYGSLGVTATSTLTAGANYYQNQGVNEYNPEMAKQLLTDAGYGEGDIVLDAVIVNTPTNTRIAEALQAALGQAGITMNINSYDTATAMTYFQSGELDIAIVEGNLVAIDPAIMYATAASTYSNKCSALSDEYLNELIAKARWTTDESVREETYIEIQEYMAELHRWIPIAEKSYATIFDSDINFAAVPGTYYPSFKDVTYN